MSLRDFVVEDSGKRQEFDTGAVRDTEEDKPRYDLIAPLAMPRVAMQYTKGIQKYGERNWEKGIPMSRYFASALRHLWKWFLGCKREDHLAAAVFNIMGIMHTEEAIKLMILPKNLADTPDYTDKRRTPIASNS